MKAEVKGIIKKGIAVGLIALMACINPLQTLSPANGSDTQGQDLTGQPTVASAAEKAAPYVGEVRLAVDKKADKAKQILIDAGYEVIDQDLNEDAGSFWNNLGDQAVYMGIKRTDDENKAIREMKTMNMLGNYSYSGLKERLEQSKKEAKELYKKISAGISEFASNYNAKDIAAETAYSMMNIYREDDSDKLVGDILLGEPDEDTLLSLLVQGNSYAVAAILKAIVYGAEKSTEDGDVWTERLSKVTSYSALVKRYAKEKYGKEDVVGEEKEQVEKLIVADLDTSARAILSQWPEIRKIFTSVPESEQHIMDTDGEIKDAIDILNVAEDVSKIGAAGIAKQISYGKKTAYDLFTVASSSFEKNIKNLYPLVYALSPAQRALMEVANFADLFQAAELRRTVAEDKSVEKDIVETRTDLEESDIVSVYDGVDRDMFADNAAMTSAATAKMKAVDNGYTDLTAGIGAGMIVISSILTGVGLYYLGKGAVESDIAKVTLKRMQENYSGEIQSVVGKSYDSQSPLMKELARKDREIQDLKKNIDKAGSDSFNLGVVLLVIAVLAAAVSVYSFYRANKNEYNRQQLPIPEVLVDFDAENKAGKYVTYHVVKWNKNRGKTDRADRADLNGDAARQWLALYVTTDDTMGAPILADGIVARTGDSSEPTATGEGIYVPLTMFGQSSIQNLVDKSYSYNDYVDGIWLWYQKSNTGSETVVDDVEDVEEEVVAEADDASLTEEDQATAEVVSGTAAEEDIADTTGSNIGRGSAVFIGLGGVTVGIISGIFIGFFIRRKKQVVD